MRTVPSAAALLLAAALPAQRLPDPVDHGREIQIHDLRPALEAFGSRDPLPDLAGLARAFLQPRLPDPTALQPLGADLLVLRGDPEQQAALERMLRAWSRARGTTMEVGCELLRVPQAAFAARVAPALGWDEIPPGGGATVGQAVLDPEQAGALRERLAAAGGVESLQSPRLALLPGRTGTIEVRRPVYYRRDHEVEVVDGKRVVWPITGKLDDGFALRATVAPLGGDTVGVELRGSLLEVARPIPSFETTLPGGAERVVVDLPTVTVRELNGTLRLGEDRLGVVVGGTADDDVRIVLLVHASRV